MGYLIQQMWICLLLATLIGAFIGWLLKRLSCRTELDELETTWRSKLDRVESDRDGLQRQLADSSTAVLVTAATASTAPSTHPVEDVEGIGKSYGKKLREMGLTTTQELLEKCCQMDGLIQVAEKIGIEDFVIEKWARMCDLIRVSGIDGQIAELMVHADIDSVQELAKKKPERLHTILTKSNLEQYRVEAVPSASLLEQMISQAKALQVIMKD